MSVEPSTISEPTYELTKDHVWSFRDEVIQLGFDLSEVALIEALPASGKSRGCMEWAADTGNYVTLLAPRHTLLTDEYEPWCDKFDLTYKRLPSFYRDCASFEENDNEEYEPVDDLARELKREYERGFHGEDLHASCSDLPCQAEGECPFVTNRNFNPDAYDVLLGTYRHVHREKWINGRYVAFDEFPQDAFLKTFDEGIEPVVSAYLEDKEVLPFEDYFDFVTRKDDPSVQDSIETWKESLTSWAYDYKHVQQSPNTLAHALAPIVVLALVEMDRLDNNWQYSDLGYGRVAVRNPKKNEWTFLLPPDLSSAESVIGLDGTPNEALWKLALNEEIQSLPLLNSKGKREYLQEVLGLEFIQTTEGWKAIQSGEGAAPPKDLALIEGISRKEGQTPALISSQKGIRQYRSEGLEELTNAVEHYSNLKGMNTFEKERLGIVLGNPHPGDDEIEKWAALAGESAERKEVNGEPLTGKDTDYGSFGNEVMYTLVHDEVLQAAMRFGRHEDVQGATVFIHTSAIPGWVPVEKKIPTIQSWLSGKKGMKKTIKAIRTLEGWQHRIWKATELYDLVAEIEPHTVRDRLDDLAEQGYIEFQGKKGQGNSKHYTNLCLDDAGSFGHVEFPE